MRFVDRLLQSWRARMARPWIPQGARVLDIGCHQGEFLCFLGDRIGPSTGIDPCAIPESTPSLQLIAEEFKAPTSFSNDSFDVIVMLATLEHIEKKEPLCRECFRLLRPFGRLVITVPAKAVDSIVHLLCRLRLADGMSLDEHHGFDPRETQCLFCDGGFTLERWQRFQLGLNHLFVFQKPAGASSDPL